MTKHTLIITEKPDAAKRIAQALDKEQKPQKHELNRVPYYIANRDERLVVVPAIGHLYTVTSEGKGRSHYPIFTYRWAPRYLAERNAKQTCKWIESIVELAQEADRFIDACDYDIEGSIIGYNILKYACGNKENDARRMKYSTLTKEELEKAYEELLPHLDFALIEAGRTRHEVDWLYGINLTRALTTAAKNYSGRYATLSTGRVQGPTLKFIALRERSIRTFVPTPYWTIRARAKINGHNYEAEYEKLLIETKKKASAILDATKGKNGIVKKIEKQQCQQLPPVPFDLGGLQGEAYRLFGYTPKRTLDLAQRLYLDALISYPRTSSQKLPPTIGYETILRDLNRLPEYRELTLELLQKRWLRPNEGKKEDPAHPSIFPTGKRLERQLEPSERRVLDFIIRRFMAVFGEPAIRQVLKVTLDINEHSFYLRGGQTLKKGWLRFYEPYTETEEVILPEIEEGQIVNVQKVILEDKFTKPPARYNPSSLLRKMEKTEIGTKATRAEIIQTMYNRKYVKDDRFVVTDLGFEVLEVLERFCPTVVSIKLTKALEEKMSKIQTANEKRENVLTEAVGLLRPVTTKLKENEEAIGKQLADAIRKAKAEERIVGTCPNCKTGKLVILYSRKTGKRFIGCTNYFNNLCGTTYPLPQMGAIRPLARSCRACGLPVIQVKMQRRRPWILCINLQCPSKEGRRNRIEMQNM